MFPSSFSSLQFFQKKREAILLRATSGIRKYFLKVFLTKEPSAMEALRDEYETLSTLSHPGIPMYYGLNEHFSHPEYAMDAVTLCLSDCTPKKPLALSELSESLILSIMLRTGELLSWLLDKGVLYTDLNPSNLLVDMASGKPEVTLIDFTYCYYFIRNPYPSYGIRFSYHLNPQLRGQQMLIQELSFLLHELMESSPSTHFSSQIYALLETGLHPSDTLSLNSYLLLLKELLV